MQKLAMTFTALTPMRRAMVVVAALATVLAVVGLSRFGGPSMALLYSGLEPAAAGEVIESLDQMGVAYEVRGAAIYVDGSKRDSLRMALAAEGKPSGGAVGYEILDNLSGFGTTSQMFDAAYWRAREGELARTILASPAVSSARVHISATSAHSFRTTQQASASVVVTAPSGLTAAQAKAMRFLVASAVPGLDPAQVSIIDAERGLVGSGDDAPQPVDGERAAVLKSNVERLLEARVGPGNAVVEVNVDTVTEREEIVERLVDPDSRVAISTVTEETQAQASDNRGGAVTVASNLPDGDTSPDGADSSSQDSRTREQVNYEVSETHREILRAPGAVRRISVAVLVNGVRGQDAQGNETWEARPEEEIAALHDLVASAVGFDEARGDSITIRSMAFPPVAEVGTAAPDPSLVDRLGLDIMSLVQIAALSLTALILGLFVVRPVLAGGRAPALPAPAPVPAAPALSELPPLSGDVMPQMAMVDNPGGFAPLPALGSAEETPAERMRRLVSGRQAEASAILQGWMENRGGAA